MSNDVIIRFDEVSFHYHHARPIMHEASMSVRRGSKITLMGQNGAGKSTLFGLIMGRLEPEEGEVHITKGMNIAISRQVIPREELQLTVEAFFQKCFKQKVYDIEPRIEKVLDAVNFPVPKEWYTGKLISDFSGGQQARLLLASALIQNPDILLLDEPTNNLDHAGIDHLTKFLVEYEGTVIVISHDKEFLNAFTTGVLYLNVHNQKIEQYDGNYNNVLKEIEARIERERRANAQRAKEIQEKKDKVNYFAQKGGNMRKLAARLRDDIEDAEDEIVDVRKDDRTIKQFQIPVQEDLSGALLTIKHFTMMKNHKVVNREANIIVRKNEHLRLIGPNGIGKTTLLETLANGTSDGAKIQDGVRVGYYRQDFSTLKPKETVYQALTRVCTGRPIDEEIRAAAGGFLLGRAQLDLPIEALSEGQKAMVSLAQLVLMKPGLIIMDEPTNHVNFRHIPNIAKALSDFKGALIMVSHVPEFVAQVRIDHEFDLDK